MRFLLRFWYVILLALVLSMGAAVGILYLERDDWMPKPVEEVRESDREQPGMSERYREWTYSIDEVEDLRVKLEAERQDVEERKQELERVEQRVQSEMEELADLRQELERMREAISREVIEVQEGEREQVERLASVYGQMKPAGAVAIFEELEIPFVVKILSEMEEESAARILNEMSEGAQNEAVIKRAAKITEEFQRVR